jgi:hypothetical protein
VNLKFDRPPVHVALLRLEAELESARRSGETVIKIVHGYGSSGEGGDIRIAVQARLGEWVSGGRIAGSVFGESWAKSDETTWHLLREHPELKRDPDLGRGNRGITIMLL